jgi:hypothetical protein
MLRPVIIILMLGTGVCSAAVMDAASEYRRDALDAEEEARDFFREKFRLYASKNVSAGFSYSYVPDGRKKSMTWNIVADDESLPVTFIAGNFYAQEGSGLLYGKLRPYNPDPFEVETPLCEQKNFAPCNSSNPAYAFNGGGICFYGGGRVNPSFIASGAVSRCVRFIASDAAYPDSTDDSFTAIFGRCDKKYPNETPVVCRTFLGSCAFLPLPAVRCELSALAVTLSDEGDGKMNWGRTGKEGVRSYTGTEGTAAYLAYNDGAVKSFIEAALTRIRSEGEGPAEKTAHSFQGEFSFLSRVTSLSIRGKSVASGYGSPYYSVYGSRSPSDGVFISLKLSPSRRFVCGADAGAERKRAGGSSTEGTKEMIFFRAEPLHRVDVEMSHTSIWDQPSSAPSRSREKIILGCGRREIRSKAGFILQRSAKGHASVFFLSLACGDDDPHRIEAGGQCVFASRQNSVLARVIGSGGQPFISVKEKVQIYDIGYSYGGEIIRAGFSAAAAVKKTRCTDQRMSFDARCVW